MAGDGVDGRLLHRDGRRCPADQGARVLLRQRGLSLRTHPVIRHPRPDESLTDLFGAHLEKYAWNLDHVYVADVEGELVAGCIVWDAGHDLVHIAHLGVREEWRMKGVAKHLTDVVLADLAARGRKIVITETPSVEMAYWAQKRGAHVTGPVINLWMELTHG